MRLRAVALFAGISLGVALGVGCSKSQTTASNAEAQIPQIEVQPTGFVPSSVHVPAEQVAHVRFVRKTDQTCAKEVVFPGLGIDKKLPLNHPVDVEIPAGHARTLAFACGMGMLKGKVVVE